MHAELWGIKKGVSPADQTERDCIRRSALVVVVVVVGLQHQRRRTAAAVEKDGVDGVLTAALCSAGNERAALFIHNMVA
jgi:hypothetical protein